MRWWSRWLWQRRKINNIKRRNVLFWKKKVAKSNSISSRVFLGRSLEDETRTSSWVVFKPTIQVRDIIDWLCYWETRECRMSWRLTSFCYMPFLFKAVPFLFSFRFGQNSKAQVVSPSLSSSSCSISDAQLVDSCARFTIEMWVLWKEDNTYSNGVWFCLAVSLASWRCAFICLRTPLILSCSCSTFSFFPCSSF